jgi:hypothetical protein
LVTALAACAAESAETPEPKLPAPGARVAVQQRQTETAEAAERTIREVLAVVSNLRELEPKGELRGRVLSRDEMMAYVRRQLRSDVPSVVVRASEQMLFALHAVPEDFDYEVAILSFLQAELAGFYDPKQKIMYLGRDLDPAEWYETLSHELVHALQDQHYDLAGLTKWSLDAGDKLGAVHSLAEGDATSAMFDVMLAPQGVRATDIAEDDIESEARKLMQASPADPAVPPLVRRSMLAPYMDGLRFVQFLRRRGASKGVGEAFWHSGWKGVDEAWRRLPASTEQLLHPEKWLSDEQPESIVVPGPPASDPSKLVYHDVLGEQSLRLLFEEWMPRGDAAKAASDWAGDRVAVFGGGDRWAVAWQLRFDTEQAAARAAIAMAQGVLKSASSNDAGAPVSRRAAERALEKGALCRERPARGPFAVLRGKRDLVLALGPFRRTESGARAEGDCRAARAWAAKILRNGTAP